MQSATGAETTSMSTRVEDVPTATAAAAGPRCYRDEVRSTVELAALVYRPLAASGVVLNILRGGLFHQRGVRNVMDVTAVSTLDSTHDGDAAAVRVDYVAVDGSSTTTTVGADAPTATAPAHLHGRCKLCLLDPARVSAVEGLRGCGPVFRVGAGVDGASVVQCAEAAVAAGRLPRAAADLLLLLQDRLSSGAVAEAGAATTAHGRKRSSAAAVGVVEVSFTTRLVELSYRNYTMPELLAMVLPVEEETALVALSGFEQVGHIAHVNLSAAHLPHADVIGQVILDCNDTVRIVVNKVDAISSVFREFKMDIIAERRSPDDVDESAPPPRAESLTAAERLAVAQDAANSTPAEAQLNCRLTATVRQHGCSFRVPYNRVYWNSRLSFEHTRLVESMSPGDLLFDVMAGVGPFAVPAARSGVFVLANDLNPVAAQYMRVNAELNNVPANMLTVYNMDGRDFLNTVLLESITGTTTTSTTTTAAASPSPPPPPHLRRCTGRRHVVMNLPAIAVTFLDVFKPCNATASSSSSRSDGGRCCWTHLPADVDKDAVDRRALFHVYCFSAAADLAADAVRQVEENLGYALPSESVEGTLMVRDVAPTKRMMCVSFTLPPAFWERLLASPSPCGDRSATESPLKRMRAD